MTNRSARSDWFNPEVTLPPGLAIGQLARVIASVENETEQFVDIFFEQANVFSALVGIFGARAFSSLTIYEKHRHSDLAQQRFPDLKRRGSADPPAPEDSLEIKASLRPWALQAHYDHAGWYCVFRYLVDPTGTIDPGKHVLIWRLHMAFLQQSDWKYQASTAGSTGGGRTHTFGAIRPATKLATAAAFSRPDITIRNGKPVPRNGN